VSFTVTGFKHAAVETEKHYHSAPFSFLLEPVGYHRIERCFCQRFLIPSLLLYR
jgi:hypothetical protein